MRCTGTPTGLVVHTPAKVNLFLNVLGKRADGYHDLDTVMLSIGLHDTLTFERRDDPHVELTCELTPSCAGRRADPPPLSTNEDNLVMRAARLLQTESGGSRGAHIHLVKRIPMQAGLGGGSSDAAATLVGLNQLWQLELPSPALHGLAAQLGSDVNFFLDSPLLAVCRGRGERIEPRPLTRTLHLVLVKPTEGLSTRDVFQEWGLSGETRDTTSDDVIRALNTPAGNGVAKVLWNSLEGSAGVRCAAVRTTLETLRRIHGAAVLMSGSGTCCFALCDTGEEAQSLAARLRHLNLGEVFAVESGI